MMAEAASPAGARCDEVRLAWNPYRATDVPAGLVPPADPEAERFHRGLPGYAPTPLRALPGLARRLGLGALWLKDESARLGLGAFKVLGASYAIDRLLRRPGGPRPAPAGLTFATATDGNHGRAVAWTARSLGHRAVIYVPASMAPARLAALRAEGAEVVVVRGTYDDAVRQAAADSASRGWQVVSDTAYPGYTDIPAWIMAGYETLFAETSRQLARAGAGEPDLLFLQAGVGGLAGAGAAYHVRRAGARRPRLVVVEPTDADCLLESILSPGGERVTGRGGQDSIMAGLNCGTPSLVAWPLLRAAADAFLAVPDRCAERAMRLLAAGADGDPRVVAGESGAAGLAGVLALVEPPGPGPDPAAARRALGLDGRTAVLLVNTEGATDPDGYRRVVGAEPG